MVLAREHVAHDGDEKPRDGLPAVEHARDRGPHRRGAAAVVAVLERGLDLRRGREGLRGDEEGARALDGLRHCVDLGVFFWSECGKGEFFFFFFHSFFPP